jgi:hypothetical protein
MANLKLQGHRAAVVIPSDTDNIIFVGSGNNDVWPCVLYVGTGGNLRVLTESNDDVTFVNVQGGSFFPVQVIRVFADGTDAEDIVAIW